MTQSQVPELFKKQSQVLDCNDYTTKIAEEHSLRIHSSNKSTGEINANYAFPAMHEHESVHTGAFSEKNIKSNPYESSVPLDKLRKGDYERLNSSNNPSMHPQMNNPHVFLLPNLPNIHQSTMHYYDWKGMPTNQFPGSFIPSPEDPLSRHPSAASSVSDSPYQYPPFLPNIYDGSGSQSFAPGNGHLFNYYNNMSSQIPYQDNSYPSQQQQSVGENQEKDPTDENRNENFNYHGSNSSSMLPFPPQIFYQNSMMHSFENNPYSMMYHHGFPSLPSPYHQYIASHHSSHASPSNMIAHYEGHSRSSSPAINSHSMGIESHFSSPYIPRSNSSVSSPYTPRYACRACIRGHRAPSCKHQDRPLFAIRPRGRPPSQCPHCKEARKSNGIHVKCICGNYPSDGHNFSNAISTLVSKEPSDSQYTSPLSKFSQQIDELNNNNNNSNSNNTSSAKDNSNEKNPDTTTHSDHVTSPLYALAETHLANHSNSSKIENTSL